MRFPSIYAAFCVLVLSLFAYAKYQGYAIDGVRGPYAGGTGATRGASGIYGYHK